MKTVLFLCTGNYYRSRYAEMVFNHLAADSGLPWRADSSGLAIELGQFNVGPISQETIGALTKHGIACDDPRNPKKCTATELQKADLVVALKEVEHRPMLTSRFPAWADRVEYWHVHDLDQSTADEALPQIHRHVVDLIERLKKSDSAVAGG